MRSIISGIAVILLVATLMGTFYLGYHGIGLVDAGGPSVRQGSTSGPGIFGGGPSSGK